MKKSRIIKRVCGELCFSGGCECFSCISFPFTDPSRNQDSCTFLSCAAPHTGEKTGRVDVGREAASARVAGEGMFAWYEEDHGSTDTVYHPFWPVPPSLYPELRDPLTMFEGGW